MTADTREFSQVLAHKREMSSRVLTLEAQLERVTKQLAEARMRLQADIDRLRELDSERTA